MELPFSDNKLHNKRTSRTEQTLHNYSRKLVQAHWKQK